MKRINPGLLKPSRLKKLLKPRELTPLTFASMLQKKIKDKMAQAQSPSSISTCFSKDDIVEAITDNARNNFNKVIGLPYFCGRSESSLAPKLKCITSAHSWIVDIENRT